MEVLAHKIEAVWYLKGLDTKVFSENLYLNERDYKKIPDDGWDKNIDFLFDKYKTSDKIKQVKEMLCKQIMEANDEDFYVYEGDTDCYNVEESELFKL